MADHHHRDHHREPERADGDDRRMWTEEFWDERYAGAPALWSGRPNPRLVAHAVDLAPGLALDVGCGEGADAIWLAERGWSVTGIDISGVALERAAGHADAAGVTDRVGFRRVDLLDPGAGEPPESSYDLVSVQFLHVASADFAGLYTRLAAAVRPGGSLLVAGHHPDDVATGLRDFSRADVMITPERVTALLAAPAWEIRYAGSPTRPATTHDGEPATATDAVVHAVRR